MDILGIGCSAVDDLLFVPAYPAADSKMQVLCRDRHCGGLTATALVAATRLGARCAYAGTLGDDELSGFVEQTLAREGVDLSYLRREPSARPFHSTIIVDQQTGSRTILYSRSGVREADPEWPPPEAISAAKVLFVDHVGVDGMIRAVELAHRQGIPVVADLEDDSHPRFIELLAAVDHLILSRDFAAKVSGRGDPAEAARCLLTPNRRVVVVTCGIEGCVYVSPDDRAGVGRRAAFPVEAVDTTGCGDVFHGAYAAALVEGLDLSARLEFASAAAAIKATRPGGQAGIPRRQDVAVFLAGLHPGRHAG